MGIRTIVHATGFAALLWTAFAVGTAINPSFGPQAGQALLGLVGLV